MTLDEQKDATVKAICLYVADLLEKENIKMIDAGKIIAFLIGSVEEAKTVEDIHAVSAKAKEFWPSLPAFQVNF